jgi:hypothetical protein
VQGNYIGTDVNGARALIGTGTGISILNSDNVIGGTVPGARNVISGNSIGVQLGLFSSGSLSGNVIQGNFIGLDALGTQPVPNTQWVGAGGAAYHRRYASRCEQRSPSTVNYGISASAGWAMPFAAIPYSQMAD